ncbi:transient receptor potential cation channel subfamily V member 5-like [Dendronephthya gigantea]|uniref:transient receptor potential cation channel subfamily V member 5-like n=1 Tax=Dendronephthya gigantea TaxID=151771 RepID=UPI001069BB19|nr:transient receptor potential cation channel subfamily V member 5-like [Dendronephthya gigantea]XP_028403085.1 transient receptor potential cation channel subfamily V member 5-like [Dendronephthya gigantea]XP_028403086.1 transient receptor potential cation channel subfamily V member 5-like [Dendronephthya gigantea]
MKKTVTAVLNKLIDPVWPYLPNREDREESGNRNDITKALESVPNDPLDYDFYYHILETDDNGNVPDDDSNFNKESVSCLRHIADCSTDDKEAVQHPVVRMLAVKKWKKFGFWWFCFEAALYALFFTVLSFALIYGSTRDHPTRYEGPADIFRALCEICSIIFLMVQFVQMTFEIAREKSRYFDFFNCINILSMIIFILFVIPLRFVESNSQWLTAAIGYLLCFIHLFKYSNVSRITGLYTTTIVKMIMEDVKRFMLFFAVIFIGFCGTMFLALKVDGTQDSYSFSSIMLGGFKALVGQGTLEEDDEKKFGWLASVVLLVYMGVLTVMLLNILIAQFGFTYAEARKTARIQYAADIMRIVTRLEYSRFERWNYRENTYEPGAKMTDEELAEEMLESTEGRHPWETDEEKIGSVREAMKRVLKTDRGKEKDPLETVKEELMQSINEKFTSLTAMMEQMKKESEQMKKESQPSE